MAESNTLSSNHNFLTEEDLLARSLIYRFLSFAFRYPDNSILDSLQELWIGVEMAISEFPGMYPTFQLLEQKFNASPYDKLENEYIALFGHSAQGNCPPFEIEYGENGEDIQKPHKLSDIAAFYKAAGLKPSIRSHERVDFVAIELEFMNFLLFKQAFAEEKNETLLIDTSIDMQKKFLHDHLARWIPAFTRRVIAHSKDGFYGTLSKLTLQFVLKNCKELGVESGSKTLNIRVPIDLHENCMECSLSKGNE